MNPQHRHRTEPRKPQINPEHVRAGLITLLGAVLLIAVATITYRTTTTSGSPGNNTATATHHMTYHATSTGKTVIVTYTQGSNGVDGQTTAPSPWTITTTTTAGVAVLTVTSGGPDSVTCAIVDTTTGQTLVRNAVPPSNGATVTCVTGNLGT